MEDSERALHASTGVSDRLIGSSRPGSPPHRGTEHCVVDGPARLSSLRRLSTGEQRHEEQARTTKIPVINPT